MPTPAPSAPASPTWPPTAASACRSIWPT